MSHESPTSLPSWIPQGARLDDATFSARHRVLLVVLLGQLPVIALIGMLGGHGGFMLWGQLAAVVALVVPAYRGRTQLTRSAAASLALMICADILVYAGGGLTDLHIWFYVMLSLVALYQMWAPFLLAFAFVAVHHLGMTWLDPTSVFSDPRAQRNPLPFALLHAFFLLAMAIGLAIGWRFAEQAALAREAERRRADEERTNQLEELARERARSASEAAQRLEERETRSIALSSRLDVLQQAGGRLSENVSTATSVMEGLRAAISEIASAASMASSTAQDANERSEESAATIARLSETMGQIEQIAGAIATIADQTNLLALNATIEAARAGEAGRGFAVVASEVKDLASETAQATAQIRGVVETVRADVTHAGTTIGQIRHVMQDVVAAQGTIAAAVEEQTAATSEATHAIQGAAEEAARMASDLQGVLAESL